MAFHYNQIRSPDLASQYMLLPLAISTNILTHSAPITLSFILFIKHYENTNALSLRIYYHYSFCLPIYIFLACSLIQFTYLLRFPFFRQAFPDPSFLLPIYILFFIFILVLKNIIYLNLTSHYILIYCLCPLLEAQLLRSMNFIYVIYCGIS